jgi:plasmid stabilization system protein ParE
MQALANNPTLGLAVDEVSTNACRYLDGRHVFYYLHRESDVVFVGFLSSNMAPEKHLERVKSIKTVLDF